MSKVSIAGDVNGTGVFTIAAPNGNTNRTITLPDEAGTILTTAGVPSSALPSGSTLQTVQYLKIGSASATVTPLLTTSSSAIQTVMSKTITTVSNSSKILVRVGCVGYSSSAVLRVRTYVYKAETIIAADAYGFYNGVGVMSLYAVEVLDSPAVSAGTTLTYSFRVAVASSGTSIIGYGDAGGGSTDFITLTEIAA